MDTFVKGGKSPKDIESFLESAAFYAMIWSLGSLTDAKGRTYFNAFLRAFIAGKINSESEEYGAAWDTFNVMVPDYKDDETRLGRCCKSALPDGASCYDFFFDSKTSFKWSSWSTKMPKYKIGAHAEFSSILVPTIDTVRTNYMITEMIMNKIHVLVSGDTGTGKSVQAKQVLTNDLDQEVFSPIFLNFSAQTSENQTQDIIDAKFKKTPKGCIWTPPWPKVRCHGR
jgi:dynein heavy chain